MARLVAYHRPGQNPELENVLSRAAILCDGDEIRSEDMLAAGLTSSARSGRFPVVAAPEVDAASGRPLKAIVEDTVRAVERQAIADALQRAEGSPAKAAKLLGISRASIYNKIKEYRIQP